jgi:hypothetical protein
MTERDGSFLSRWSRRKTQVREDLALRDEAASPLPAPTPLPTSLPTALPTPRPSGPAAGAPTAMPAAPAPTLDDVAALLPQSDYTRFVARGVTPEVKNAALKKLFTDPHFNIMDGLDTYIDDYGKPDPLPASMLRQMVQSQLLGLFDEEKKADTSPACSAAAPAAADVPDVAALTASCTADEIMLRAQQPGVVAGRTGPAPSTGQVD